MLSYRDKQNIMNDFPFIELSYEKKIYKKVHQSDICLVIPKGKKNFAWFRQYKNKFVCFVMELENKKKIKDITIFPCVVQTRNMCWKLFYMEQHFLMKVIISLL